MDGMKIVNGCLVCRNPERPPTDGFDLAQPDLNLWVMEVPFERSEVLDDQFDLICNHLIAYESVLSKIGTNHDDFSLNLTFEYSFGLINLPLSLIQLASRFGFELGVIVDQSE